MPFETTHSSLVNFLIGTLLKFGLMLQFAGTRYPKHSQFNFIISKGLWKCNKDAPTASIHNNFLIIVIAKIYSFAYNFNRFRSLHLLVWDKTELKPAPIVYSWDNIQLWFNYSSEFLRLPDSACGENSRSELCIVLNPLLVIFVSYRCAIKCNSETISN